MKFYMEGTTSKSQQNQVNFSRIMTKEAKLAHKYWEIPPVSEIFKVIQQINEVAESSSILRSYNGRYNLTDDKYAYESVSAHTNLCYIILDRCLSYMYGPKMNLIPDGCTYRELMEAIRRHDLPENVIGDIPDNGGVNVAEKRSSEKRYFDAFSSYSPFREDNFERNVNRLLREMDFQSSLMGRVLYMADKTSAIIITLWHDSQNRHPLMMPNSDNISERDATEMRLCDKKINGGYRASEMWTIDFLKVRNLVQYDDTGYFTALIVAYTLQVNGRWYKWRERDYI